jgi:hypothetical protein
VWHPDPDRLTLAALPGEPPDPQVAGHLADCALCRGHVEGLRRTVFLAREGGDVVADGEAPPAHVWRAITDELEIEPAPAAPDAPATPQAGSRRRGLRRLALPLATAAAGLAVGLVAGLGLGPGGAAGPVEPQGAVAARLAPVGPLDPGGTGEVAMVDVGGETRMQVTVAGVDDLAGGDYLEVWLLDPAQGRLVSVGALARHDDGYRGTFTVPAGLPAEAYGTVDVSAERWDGDPSHSTVSLLRGPLA